MEVKHGIQVRQESLTPLSLSHPVYYQVYRQIFGLTGTLGSQTEREELREIYGLSSFNIPTHLPIKRIDHPPQPCSPQAHLSTILDKILSCHEQGRPVLVLSETIAKTEEIGDLLQAQKIPHLLFNELQEKTEDKICAEAGKPQAITIATNTAGRGTDIILDPLSLQKGGLYVLITYLSPSLRVEEQARGRAGRQGQIGSSEVLFSSSEHASDIQDVLNQREQRARLQKDFHLYWAKWDRFRFSLATRFFHKRACFQKRLPTLIPELAWEQMGKKLADPTRLQTQKGQAIANSALFLMTDATEESSFTYWHALLHQIAIRLQDLVLQDWATLFYQNTDELFSQTLHQDLLGTFPNKGKKAFHALQNTTEQNFTKQMAIWEEHLDLSGKGILLYLRKTQIGKNPTHLRDISISKTALPAPPISL